MFNRLHVRSGFVALSFLLALAAAKTGAQTNLPSAREIAPGPYQPTWESLAAHYQCPERFRDAKSGIWAVFGPQCQPEDGDEKKIVGAIGAWLNGNGEAIYATRPGKIFGEGPSAKSFVKGPYDGQTDSDKGPFTPADIRFTQSKDGKNLYAIVLALPVDGKITVQSLAENFALWQNEIGSAKMLGARGKLQFTRDESGLHLPLPDKMPGDIAFALKISR
jgi:hypothetical protein